MRHDSAHRRGFTLIELTVVLAVLVTLALILTPAIANIINDSRSTRAQQDCQTMVTAIVQFYRDTGYFPQWATARAGGPGLPQQRLQVLVTPGRRPFEEQLSPWSEGTSDLLANQLMTNAPGYLMRGPESELGWNGPYLSSPIASDPWGNRYVVNIGLVDTSPGVVTVSGQPKAAVWVLSAGPNGTIETPYFQSTLTASLPVGDDIGFRIQ